MTDRSPPPLLVVGAGLAGCEAAALAARAGLAVRLVDQKPVQKTPAQRLDGPAELVCSNSLGSDQSDTAAGQLKFEMALLGSVILPSAIEARVPAGGSLSVNREQFSEGVARRLSDLGLSIECASLDAVPDEPAILATGPLTSEPLATSLAALTGSDALFFFDATSPIVAADSIDRDVVFAAGRWGKGGPDYLNCPMTREQYDAFYAALMAAEKVTPHAFEDDRVFEACQPIESLARRGERTLLFGPMRPVGLDDPRTGRWPHAVVQLRREDAHGEAYNLVGFQTRMKWGDQQRVLRMIPGLENAEFLRLGVMHRNTYLDGPRALDPTLALRARPAVRCAGQMTGVEGYTESAACGLLAGLFAVAAARGIEAPPPPETTILGALYRHVTASPATPYQPMNANLGILPGFDDEPRRRPKSERRAAKLERARADATAWRESLPAALFTP